SSAASEVISAAPQPPANISPPSISGIAQSGQALAGSPGTWTNTPTSFTYQWQRCDPAGAGCKVIAGARASSYTLAEVDVGMTLRVSVIASNAVGPSAPASSAASEVITASTGVQ